MKRILMMLPLLIISLAALAHGPTTTGDASADVRGVLLQNAKGFENADMHMLDSIWAHETDVTVFENGHANYGWADYRDHHLEPEVKEMKNVRYQLTDIKPHVAGDSAWATFKYSVEADYKGQKVDAAGLGTAVLEKRKGEWKIVHWHTSAPRKKPAETPAKKD